MSYEDQLIREATGQGRDFELPEPEETNDSNETGETVLDATRRILTGRNAWIVKHLPFAPTPTQTPYDLITLAIRDAGFDFFAANGKAREIIDASNLNKAA